MNEEIVIYVLPSVPHLPPRAVLGQVNEEEGKIEGSIATWNADMGQWCIGGEVLEPSLGELITEHAKSLGVEW